MDRISKSKIKVGIIGCDSFHTVAFCNNVQTRNDCEIAWIDKTNYSNLEFSKERQPRLEAMLDKSLPLYYVDLDDHDAVDVYCVLNVDASIHLEIIKKIRKYDKPIFVDKPMFYDLDEFTGLYELPIMSCSGFRCCDFVLQAKGAQKVKIEGPLSFVEGIDGYFWYGIHLIEMLHTITNSPIIIESIEISGKNHHLYGRSGRTQFEILGHTQEDIMFSVYADNQKFELDSYDTLYQALINEIIMFARNPTNTLKNTYEVIKTVIEINQLIEKRN